MADETPEEKQLRLQSAAYQNLLSRWPHEVGVPEARGWDATKVAAEFGKLGLQSAVLLNGGALVVMPPLMQWLPSAGRALLASQAGWFAAGVMLAALAIAIAYINFSAIAEGLGSYAAKRAIEVDAQYANKEFNDLPQHVTARARHSAFSKAATVTAWIALGLAISSFVCFAIGVFGFMHLADVGAASACTAARA